MFIEIFSINNEKMGGVINNRLFKSEGRAKKEKKCNELHKHLKLEILPRKSKFGKLERFFNI